MAEQRYDVIVMGVGSMGAATCHALAERGVKVLGLEQFTIAHENGSHAGRTRMVRKAYFEHPDYVPLLNKAYDLWGELEQKTGQTIFHKTGLLYLGPKKDELLEGVKYSAKKYGIPLTKLSTTECQARYPAFRVPTNYEVLFEPDSGYVVPEQVVRLYADLAKQAGATLLENQRVAKWTTTGAGVTVTTQNATYVAKKLICTAGAFTPALLPDLPYTLVPRRQITSWFAPKRPALFTGKKFPCFLYVVPDRPGAFYGFPLVAINDTASPLGVKVGYHEPGEAIDPYALHEFEEDTEAQPITDFMRRFLPEGYGSLLATKPCLYTYSDDGHFIVENSKTHPNVSVACGFSGHGFKFVPLIGEILADLCLSGTTDHPIGFLGSERFG
ncbi:MAG: N-methyl-L-tryptophan oxidase [Maribacter sp.]|nr:N-methyl-L-tryptophan oxidase [Maribacter sp.]